MPRILTKDLEQLASLRRSIHDLQEKEAALKSHLVRALPVGQSVQRGPYKVSHLECQGAPNYKEAYVALAGEEAALALPRPTYTKLTFSVG